VIPRALLGAIASARRSNDTTPLGAAMWAGGLYWCRRDYQLGHGEVITEHAPRIGAGNIAVVSQPVCNSVGIANGVSATISSTAPADYFEAHWLGPFFSGTNVGGTIVLRFQALISGTRCVIAFGNSGSGTANFLEIITFSTQATVSVRWTSAAGVAATTWTGPQLAFGECTLAVVKHPTTLDVYLNKVAIATGVPFTTGASTFDRFRIGATARSTPASTNTAEYQEVGVCRTELSAAQVAQWHDAVLALDPVVTAGTPIIFVGDSITNGTGALEQGGARGPLNATIVANLGTNRIACIGPLAGGAFDNNAHCGYSSQRAEQIATRFEEFCGPGQPGAGVRFASVLFGTNDSHLNPGLANAAAQLPITLASLDAGWRSILDIGIAGNPLFRMGVHTLPCFKSTLARPGMEDRIAAINAGVPALLDAIDTDYPSNTVIRCDLYTELGGYGSSSGTNYSDGVHFSPTGYNTWAALKWAQYQAHLTAIAA
jgi:lysophospholipase L1-like esterase